VTAELIIPLAHIGHALPLLPYFGPPLLLTAGIAGLAIRERLRGHDEDE
jgi:hypothetical protein